jgi:isocitrate dehydrogenase kinase/phosphatase
MTEDATPREDLCAPAPDDRAGAVRQSADEAAKAKETANWILREFDAYYAESRGIPDLAQAAFEGRDPGRSLALSKRRLSIYSESIHTLGPLVAEAFPRLTESETPWPGIEQIYLGLIRDRYEADLAFAYIHSIRRIIYRDEWKPVAYDFGEAAEAAARFSTEVHRRFPGGEKLSPERVEEILRVPGFTRPYQDAGEDAFLVAERVNEALADASGDIEPFEAIEVIDAGFYRNRGAYIVGRIVLRRGAVLPLVIALLNDADGIYVDAVLTSEAEIHNIFSSTLANFHVTDAHYHELAAFLYSLMPKRPLSLHYSTIGFNHVGKVAVMNELREELAANGEVFGTAVGFRGTVAIGFSAPSSAYVLKVIRDKPTAQYKWGKFDGVDAVLDKYRRVHEINRTGSMLDNIIYYNLRLDRQWFDPALLEELLDDAGLCVSLMGDSVVLKHLVVQPKMIPLPNFLETASRADAETAIVNLGHCIKNNAAANIFNKDLDGRNYGVNNYLKVYLFDYDALEPFTEVKIRTNRDRVDGEEDIPDWYFEDGIIFLPEEIEVGLRIPDRALARLFRTVHGDLLETEYWEQIQRDLNDGKVPGISVYPEERKLLRDIFRLGAYH